MPVGTRVLRLHIVSSIVVPMEMLMTCLVSLASVNIVLGLATRPWKRSVEARMVRQVRAWPGLDAYHADLLSTSEPLCSTDHQVADCC